MIQVSEKEARNILLRVETPGRYTGCEYGSHDKRSPNGKNLLTAISYPDLYEIGMSNNAVKIIYNILNRLDNVICDRVFAPARDFEEILTSHSLPLFTLENRIPLSELDILGFSFGYELTATNMLKILSLGGIPLRNRDRGKNDPVIIAGGPGVTNPVPYGSFVDLFFIGEAEGEIESLYKKASVMKAEGRAGRDELLEIFRSSPNVWYRGRESRTYRAVFSGFGNAVQDYRYYPVPSVRAVQDNGVVEIMRGCPNGCRFCHAGYYYRPKREKGPELIDREVAELVEGCGYREITLSSLSSGDYSGITRIIGELNKKYSSRGVSFSFPSLRVNSFTLPLLSGINEVRKSGLTFAIETPDPEGQRSLNKEAGLEQTISIIKQAKASGWKVAKFYFMLGLPPSSGEQNPQDPGQLFRESDQIIDFLFKVQGGTGISINVNIGTFIPKAHTPYQWAAQMREEDAMKQINYIRTRLKGQNIKLGYHAPMMSFVEGIFSRGDERAGEILLEAFNEGASFDAWEDHFDRNLWKKVIERQDWDVEAEVCRARDINEKLPWSVISLGASGKFLEKEHQRSLKGELTPPCASECSDRCGVCGNSTEVREALFRELSGKAEATESTEATVAKGETGARNRIIFSFTKKGAQVYLGHLDIMRMFEKALQRSTLDIRFTEGFNPKPRLEFANPLSLGMESECEIASVETAVIYRPQEFMEALNRSLPEGIRINKAVSMEIKTGEKIHSLMSLYAGGIYRLFSDNNSSLNLMIEKYADQNLPPGCVATESTGDFIRITVRQPEGGKSLFRILKEATGDDNPLSGISVVREKVLASPDRGNSITDYFSFFS